MRRRIDNELSKFKASYDTKDSLLKDWAALGRDINKVLISWKNRYVKK